MSAAPDGATVSRLAGQLDYLFEERPDLRKAPATQLLDRLNREDRLVRARDGHPRESDEWVQRRADELDDRYTLAEVEAAVAIALRRARIDDDD